MKRRMLTHRLSFEEWCEISSLGDQAHSLAVMLDFGCANVIADERLRRQVEDGAARALAGLLDILVARLDAIEPRAAAH